MDTSVFPDKNKQPSEQELVTVLGGTYDYWTALRDYVFSVYPNAKEEWNYPGTKYGWSFRIKDKKRAIIYLLPRDACFKAAFVFGQKAYDQIMESDIAESIKTDLQNARKYAEGRGVRIEVRDASLLPDIRQLVEIKIAN